MSIFDYVEDIEQTYKFLISKAKERNEEQIKAIRTDEEEKMNNTLQKKNEYIDYVLNDISNKIDGEIEIFQEKLEDILNVIKKSFESNNKELIQNIIEELGFDF
jgi:F0F1-type ATP synthase membrane subunit b/b'